MSLSPAVPGTDAVAVRLAPAGTPPHDLLRELGAGRVTRRPGRAPLAENGHVSISRTDGLVAVALADRPVGIDVERVRPLPDLGQLVDDHLGATDAAAVRAAPDPTRAFYAVWTGLEALLKAEGVGIVDGLDPSPERRARWQVLSLDVGPDYSAAIALPGRPLRSIRPSPPRHRGSSLTPSSTSTRRLAGRPKPDLAIPDARHGFLDERSTSQRQTFRSSLVP